MRTINFISKKLFSIYMVLIIVLSVVINIALGSNDVYAVKVQNSKTGIQEFPESYQVYLNRLCDLHPNWKFTAFNVGITWNEFMNNESSLGGESYSHGKNTVINSSDSLWKDSCNVVKSGYSCASPDIISYFADPRNFLNETGIFQFLEMSYNSEVHTKAGVESIIKNTFMDTAVNISDEEKEIEIKAKISDGYIIATPNTTYEEIANTIGIKEYEVKNKDNIKLESSNKATTGFIFIDNTKVTSNNTNTATENNFSENTYNNKYIIAVLGDVNGDGEVKSTDYMKIKSYIMGDAVLSDVQKLAADVNGDGEVKSTDYMKIKSFIMGDAKISAKTVVTVASDKVLYSDIIMKAAEESGISPYSIAIKIIQEVGRNGSNSVYGTYPGYEGYYNFYNIGAYDSGNAIENGLKYAKEKGWDNQYKSIVEGAKYMSDSYISVGQNTAYFYKFDVVDGKNGMFWHQYMTNIQDPSSQAKILYNTYTKNNLLELSLNFIIPVFDDMPDVCKLPGTIDEKEVTSYYVNGTGVNIRQNPTVNSASIGTLNINEIVTVEELNTGEADGYIWAKIKRANGTEGYVANKYLVKCNHS